MFNHKPQATATTHVLPYDQLSPRDFERLCLWLVSREGYEAAEHLGASGGEQGRDIQAWQNGERIIFQCKRVKNFRPQDAVEAVDKIINLAEEKRPKELIFLVTSDMSIQTRDAARQLSGEAFKCSFWASTEFDEKVKRYPDIINEFFQISIPDSEKNKIRNAPTILGNKSLIPVVANLSEEYVHRRRIEIPLVRCIRNKTKHYASSKIIGLVGNGGFGKTNLAKAAANDARVLSKYPDGILWIEIGPNPDLRSIIENQIRTLTGKSTGFVGVGDTGLDEAANALANELCSCRLLIVLDDVWQAKVLEYFQQGAIQSAILVTTRLPEIIPSDGIVDVQEMENEEAARLLVSWMETPPQDMTPFSNLAKKLGEWPLLVTLASGHLRESIEVDHLPLDLALSGLQERLDYYGLTAFDRTDENDRARAISISMNISLERLEKLDRLGNVRQRYLELAVFPEEEDIPFAMVERLWKATSGMERIAMEDALKAMRRLSLFIRYEAQSRTLRLHGVIRDYLREQLKDELTALHGRLLDSYGLNDWTKLPSNEPYMWQQLATHMARAKRNMGLYQLISKEWKDAKFARYSSHQPFSQDVDIAIRAADEENNLPEVARLCLLYATLGELATNVPAEVLGVLARCGQASQALGYADLIQEPWGRFEAYLEITETLLESGDPAAGIVVLQQARAAAEKIKEEWTKVTALSSVARVLVKNGNRAGAWDIIRQAWEAAEKINDDLKQALALVEVAEGLAYIGDREAALIVAEKIQDAWQQVSALSDVAEVLAKNGDWEGALEAANEIKWDEKQVAALSYVARALTENGDREEALAIIQQALEAAKNIEDDEKKAKALSYVAEALTENGDREEALAIIQQAQEVAEKIKDDWQHVVALSYVAMALTKNGDRVGALAIIQQARGTAEKIKDAWKQVAALSFVVEALTENGDREGALAIIRQALEAAKNIEDDEKKAKALSYVAEALAKNGDRVGALQAAQNINQGWIKVESLSQVAQALAKNSDREGALEAAKNIEDDEKKAKALSYVAVALAKNGDRVGAMAIIRQVLEAAEKVEDDWEQALALLHMAQILAENGDRDGAREIARQALEAADEIKDEWEQEDSLRYVAQILAENGDWEGALEAAKKIRNYGQVQALRHVAQILAENGSREVALVIVRQALEAAEKIKDDIKQARALVGVVEGLAYIGDREGALVIVRQAREAAEKIKDDIEQARALVGVAQALAEIGDREGALAIIRQALEAAKNIEDDEKKAKALSYVAVALAKNGDRVGAMAIIRQVLEAAEKIKDDLEQAEALLQMAQILAENGDRDGAREVVEKIRGGEWHQVMSLCILAQALAEIGDREGALAIIRQAPEAAEKIKDDIKKARALVEVAQALAEIGDREGALVIVRQALEAAENIKDDIEQAETLLHMAQILAESGDRDGAREIARQVLAAAEKIKDEEKKAQALFDLVKELAEIGDWEVALEAAEQIEVEWKARALSHIAVALAESGDLEGATEIGRRALEATERIKDDRMKAEVLSNVASVLASCGDEKALEAFRRTLQSARYVSRSQVFSSLNRCTSLLVSMDQGRTLLQIHNMMMEVDLWWGG